MPPLLQTFGPYQQQIWEQFAHQVGGELRADRAHTTRIRARIEAWTVLLDVGAIPGYGSQTYYTRFRAPYVNPESFRFTIYKADLFSELAHFFGMQDLEVGDTAFDDRFIIKASDRAKIRRLLSSERLRGLIEAEPDVYIQVRDHDGDLPEEFPPDVDELSLQVEGVVDDSERMRRLYELFAEILRTLSHLGEAYERDPELEQ